MNFPENGSWFNGFGEDVAQELTRVADLLFEFNNVYRRSQKAEREQIIRQLFRKTGEHFIIHSPFHCDFGNIEIGDHFLGNVNLLILDEATVRIGNHVFIGPNVAIYTIIHHPEADKRNEGIMRALPVTIGDNVWIGGNTVILPGVTIGDGAVIGAGSVVTKDIPAGMLAFGNPCRVVRPIVANDPINT
ncbi:MAG: sugar O-acetyltransferase [Bacteroidales bacterium]